MSQHLPANWLQLGTPCGGALCECDLDTACMRKRPIVLTRANVEGMDDSAEWAQPPAPAEACTDLGAEPEPTEVRLPLDPLFARHPWLGPVVVACVVIVWTCLDAYLEATP